MALNMTKLLFTLMLLSLLVTSSAGSDDGDDNAEKPYECFCPCFKDGCMLHKLGTKEECAKRCDTDCRNAGYYGQPYSGFYCED